MPNRSDLRLRSGVWRRRCADRGALTLAQKAQLVAFDAATVSRIERGSAPSSRFIAQALTVFGCEFDVLFEITDEAA